MPPFLFLLFLLTSAWCPLGSSLPHNNFTDLASLLAFKAHVSDPLGILSKNWTANASFCSWIGVTCSPRHQRVAALDLRNASLQGNISPHLSNLSFLSYLNLSNNALAGPIPTTLVQLPRLKILDLERNHLSGPVPSSLLNTSSLIELYLSYNNLSGSLPLNDSISTMPSRLQIVYIGRTQVNGRIPSTFSRCLNLQVLSLSYNNLIGAVPAELGYLPELRLLALGGNQISGEIPSSLGNLTNLRQLYFGGNKLVGGIPTPRELGNLAELQVLDLERNSLTGPIPKSLLNASMVTLLDLAINRLIGPVPPTLGESMPRLQYLSVGDNLLTGGLDFITSLQHCRNLESLILLKNELEGPLPTSVGNLSVDLETFAVGQNRIKGNIPSELGNLSGLLVLSMEGNELTGSIPLPLASLQSLQYMNLGGNMIGGSIPSELGLMTSLNTLDIEYNELSGAIPDAIGNLTGLQIFAADINSISSNIPHSLWQLKGLTGLSLSQNLLIGSIPTDVRNLNNLDRLDLSGNQLTGNISSALGELNMLTYLDLSNNSLHGQIPESLGGLISIQYLDMSRNFLSGSIPKSLAKLRYLDHLDLSFNLLEGQIPEGGVFSNLSLPLLEGNKALCGAPQLHFLPCPSNNLSPKSSRKTHVLKYILPAIAAVVALACVIIIFKIHRRKATTMTCSDSQPIGNHRQVSYHELVRATNNFSQVNLLGSGSFGSVFRGYLDDRTIVAVKVLNLEVEGAMKSFEVECQAFCSVRHRNLIKIISVCSNLDFKALILEYMPNGSLEKWLYSKDYNMNLLQRLNIMVDVSLALEYLHHRHPQVILHCDIKPSNVLLDEEMVAHVSDFGIAKLLLGDSRSIASTSTPGTIGYIAPEYGATGKVSRMGDVYSFGILLLETFTGKRPTDGIFGEESSLREYVYKAYPSALYDIVDGNLLQDGFLAEAQSEGQRVMHHCLSLIMELGLLCSSYTPKERISMTEVADRLQKIKEAYGRRSDDNPS